MRTSRLLFGLLLALAALPAGAQSQRMAMPSYFYPGPLWAKLEAAAPRCGLVIINPNSGPGATNNPDYARQVREAQAHGLIVLGYVHTSYGKRPLKTVEAEAKTYFHWYHVDGIFYDEVSNTQAGLGYYLTLAALTRTGHPKAEVVLNPGTQTVQGYMKACDILVNFESDDKAYQQYQAPAWVSQYPAHRFWHIILNVPTDADMRAVVRESKARHAGWVYVTPFGAHNANPYDKLPEEPYWSDELATLGNR